MIDLSVYAQEIKNKPVAVFGLGISGLATVKALVKSDIKVTAFDDNDKSCEEAKELGAKIENLNSIDLSDYANLILAPGVPYSFNPHPVVLNAQKHNVEIIGDIELFHRANLNIKTIGITGTNGKSTTTTLMTHVLRECGVNAVMGGNIGKAVMGLDVTNSVDVLVLEISSYQMDLCPTFSPDISIVLNVASDHLDRHGGMEEYVAAKARILEGKGSAIIGVDDDFTQVMFDQAFIDGERQVVPVSIKSHIVEGYFVKNKTLIHNHHGEDQNIFSLNNLDNLKGDHNFQNATCLYVAAKEFDIKDDNILKAFQSYGGLEHRQYKVGTKDKVTYINDSKATNAESAAKALASYENIYWIVGGQAKQGGLDGLEIFRDKVSKAYLIGEATPDFALWMREKGFEFELCATLNKAVDQAHHDAHKDKNNTVVLLSPACASWDQFKSFENRGDQFTAQVKALIK